MARIHLGQSCQMTKKTKKTHPNDLDYDYLQMQIISPYMNISLEKVKRRFLKLFGLYFCPKLMFLTRRLE